MVVNSPFIRPAISWGWVALGASPYIPHDYSPLPNAKRLELLRFGCLAASDRKYKLVYFTKLFTKILNNQTICINRGDEKSI